MTQKDAKKYKNDRKQAIAIISFYYRSRDGPILLLYSRNGQIYYTPLAAQYIRDNTYLIINAKYTTSVRICSSLFGACVDNYYNTHTRRNLIFAINHGGAYIICARK